MPNTKAELLALKQDLIKVRELIMNSLSKSSTKLRQDQIGLVDSYDILNRHLIYNGVLTSIKDDYII